MRSRVLPPELGFNRGTRLSQGTLVEGRIRARLLGIPLLKIDAVVALVPGTPSSVGPSPSPARSLEPMLSLGNGARRFEAPGSALAEAIQIIDEAADLLTEARGKGFH